MGIETHSPVINLNKKALVLSSWSPPKIGGAQNLYTIFSHINPKDYSILTSQRNFEAADGKFGETLACDYFFYDEKRTAPAHLLKKRIVFIKRFPTVFKILRGITAFITFFPRSLRLLNKINTYGADIIKKKKVSLLVGVSDQTINLLSTLLLSQKARVPYVLYLFDLYYGNQLSFPYNVLARVMEPVIFKHATRILVTNEATKEYYVQKYGDGDKYAVIYNCVSPDQYQMNLPTVRVITDTTLHIVFTGNIYWAQEKSLDNLLRLVNGNSSLNADVTVYCPNQPLALMHKYRTSKNITFISAPQSEIAKIQSEADILFLPLSWNTDAVDIIKTASPGKLTDYLIAGKPILIHAPEYSFVAKYAKANDFAEVVDTEDPAVLEAAIRRLATDREYSARLVTNAQKTFYKNHDPYTNTARLCTILNDSL